MISELQVVAILVALLVVAYLAGTYWKHRTLTGYAHWFEDRFSRRAKVKYKSFGHAGLRVRCEMTDRSDGFREMEFALTLGARENLLYYPIAIITRDHDRLRFWGMLDKDANLSLRALKAKNSGTGLQDMGSFEEVQLPELKNLGYVAYASNRERGEEFLRGRVLSVLGRATGVESFEIDRTESRTRLEARLDKEELPQVVEFLSLLGREL